VVGFPLVVAAVVAHRARRAALGLLVLAVTCGGGNQYAPSPPPEVTVTKPVSQEVTTWSEFTGHTRAIASVDMRARVAGILDSINFDPGSEVKKGDLLFVIEPALYEAQVEQARADLSGKEAQARAAQEQLAITTAIYQRKAGSKTDLVQKTQARDLAVAAVARAKATLAAAQLNLTYTHIHAPISGRIDRNYVDVGNLVGSSEATPLATIVTQDPIYAYFEVSERELLEYRQLKREGLTAAHHGAHSPAYLGLLTDEGYPHRGTLDYGSNRVDPSTGTFELRAVFPNATHEIIPGLFVRVRVPHTRAQALLVPDAALGSDLGGQFLLVVDEKDIVQLRRVRTGAMVDQLRIVEDGLGPDDVFITHGSQRVRAGESVKPRMVATPPPPPVDPTQPAG
jgi:RND family efflux transporter MFP subunit